MDKNFQKYLSARRWDVLGAFFVFAFPFFLPGWTIFTYDGLLGADRAEYHLPYVEFHHEYLRAGKIPFWNPYVYGGTPEFGNPERAPMYPPNLVLLLLTNPVLMLKIKYLFHLGLLGLGCFLLLRSLSVGRALALAGGVTLELSGFPITKIALPNVGDSATWIPLMLFLSLWFSRSSTLGRGLVYALVAGCLTLLFFPQITLSLVGLSALVGAARFVKCRSGLPAKDEAGDGQALQKRKGRARLLHRIALPAMEIGLLVALMRYPKNPVRFPDPGWRCAFDGMGFAGLTALVLIPVLWGVWLWVKRFRVAVEWRLLGRWAVRFLGVWVLAAAFAAPQLAVTGEMIAHSNQSAIEYDEDEDFFTGAQAYGSVRAFVQKSFLAGQKESVNNMALGPFVYVLVAAGLVGGFHRRHRFFLLLTVLAALTGAVYMAAPVVFDVFIRLPFFGKFSGLSRYLAFLNVFLVVLALLSAQLWVRRFRGVGKMVVKGLVWLGIGANLVVLGKHDFDYFERVRETEHWVLPDRVADAVRENLEPGERFNIDLREAVRTGENYQPFLMVGMANRFPTLATIAPMRLLNYDKWMGAHNAALGVNHDDYRAGFFEPTPTAWMRAMRVGVYLFPPGAPPLITEGTTADADSLELVAEAEGWKVMRDRRLPPVAWPETDLNRDPPTPDIPPRWEAKLTRDELHFLRFEVSNPDEKTWMVVSTPKYPGWRARVRSTQIPNHIKSQTEMMEWMEGEEVETKLAYGFLTAIPIPAGQSMVFLRYRPASFRMGWFIFLWAVWIWILLFPMSFQKPRLRKNNKIVQICYVLLVLLGAVTAWGAMDLGSGAPDSLQYKFGEFVFVALFALLAAFSFFLVLKRNCSLVENKK